MFYDRFLNLCEKYGVSPSRALTDMGISKGSLSRWKEGGKPLNENKKLIADFFGITVAELLEEPAKKNRRRLRRRSERKGSRVAQIVPVDSGEPTGGISWRCWRRR